MPFGKAAIRREGGDVTMLTIGPSLYPALDAGTELAGQGIEAEIIDARTLVPFDYDTLSPRCGGPGGLSSYRKLSSVAASPIPSPPT